MQVSIINCYIRELDPDHWPVYTGQVPSTRSSNRLGWLDLHQRNPWCSSRHTIMCGRSKNNM